MGLIGVAGLLFVPAGLLWWLGWEWLQIFQAYGAYFVMLLLMMGWQRFLDKYWKF